MKVVLLSFWSLLMMVGLGCSDAEEGTLKLQSQIGDLKNDQLKVVRRLEEVQDVYSLKQSTLNAELQQSIIDIKNSLQLQQVKLRSLDALEARLDRLLTQQGDKVLTVGIQNLDYGIVEYQFVPILVVQGDLIAEKCPCPSPAGVKLQLELVMSENNVVAVAASDVLLEEGKGAISMKIKLDQHGLDTAKLRLRWSVLGWYPYQTASLGTVKLIEPASQ